MRSRAGCPYSPARWSRLFVVLWLILASTLNPLQLSGTRSSTALAAPASMILPAVDTQVFVTVPEVVPSGGIFTYDISAYNLPYGNAGETMATNVWIVSPLPPGTTFLAASPPPVAVVHGNLVWKIGTLASGSFQDIAVTVRAPAMSAPTLLGLRAQLMHSEPALDPHRSLGFASVMVDPMAGPPMQSSPDLAVAMATAPYVRSVAPGGSMTYTIVVQNASTVLANSVALSLTVPPDVSILSVSEQGGHPVLSTGIVGNTAGYDLGSLGAGDARTVLVGVQVSPTVPVSTTLVSTAEVRAVGQDDPISSNNTASFDVTTLANRPALWAAKWPERPIVSPDGLITYTIAYGNSGVADASIVVLTETVPVSTTVVQTTPLAAIGPGTVSWNVGTVPAGGSGQVQLVVRVDPNAPDGSQLPNHVDVARDGGLVVEGMADANVMVQLPRPDLTVKKLVHQPSVAPGGLVTYTIQVGNDGFWASANAASVRLTDTLPMQTSYVSSLRSDGTPITPTVNVTGSIAWDLGPLAVGMTKTLDLVLRVHEDAMSGGYLMNLAFAEPLGQVEAEPSDNSATAPMIFIGSGGPNLFVSKLLESPTTAVTPGSRVTYTIIYGNHGSADAPDVVMTDTVSAGLSIVDVISSITPTVGVTTVVWSPGMIAPGAFATATVVALVGADVTEGQTLVNRVEIHTTGGDPFLDDNVATVSVSVGTAHPDLSVTKQMISGSPAASSEIVYRIDFQNTGAAAADDVVITDTLPVSTTFVSWAGAISLPSFVDLSTTVSPTVTGNTVVWNLGSLPAGALGDLQVTVRIGPDVPAGTTLTNTATIAGRQAESDLSNNVATVTVTTQSGLVDLAVTKHPLAPTVEPGGLVTYAIGVVNGTVPGANAMHVRLTETLPVSTTFVSAQTSAGEPITPTRNASGVVVFDLGTMAPGSRRDLLVSIRADVAIAIGNRLENRVDVAALDQADVNPFDNTAINADVQVMAPLSPGRPLPFFDDGEHGPNGWQATGFWHLITDAQRLRVITDIFPALVTLPDAGFLPPAFSGRTAWWYGQDETGTFCGADFSTLTQGPENGCTSTAANAGDLTSPPLDLSGVVSATLHFKTWWEIEGVDVDRFDLMQVLVSIDGGLNWTQLGQLNPLNDVDGEAWKPYSSGGLGVPGVWTDVAFDLTPYVGNNHVQIRFHFDTRDELYNGFRGWFVDDIAVVAGGFTVPFTVTSLSPTTVQAGNTTEVLSIIGSGFVAGPAFAVTVGGVTTTATIFSSSVVQYHLPVGLTAGVYPVVLTNGTGESATAGNLTVTTTPTPDLQAVDPISGTAALSQTIHLAGADFAPGATVWLGTTQLMDVQFVDSGHLVAIVPAGLLPGIYNVRVVNPDGQADTLVGAYQVTAPSAAPGADLVLQKEASALTVEPGDVLTYYLTYRNMVTDTAATNVWLTDTLPAGVMFQAASIPPVSTANGQIVWHFVSLGGQGVAFADRITITTLVSGAVVSGTILHNVATMTMNEPDINPGNELASADVTVVTGPDLTPPLVNVLNPKSGVVWFADRDYVIRWSAMDVRSGVAPTRSITLEYSLDGGLTWAPIAPAPVDNTGSFVWHVPNVTSDHAILRVTAADAAGNVGLAEAMIAIKPFDPQAIGPIEPSNLTDVSATLSFRSKYPAIAAITYWVSGTMPSTGPVADDFRDRPGQTHWIRIGDGDPSRRLAPSTVYQYAVYLDGAVDPIATGAFATGPTLPPWTSMLAFGRVIDAAGMPVGGAIVSVQLERMSGMTRSTASLLSAVTGSDGYWSIDLGAARTADLGALFNPNGGDQAHFIAIADSAGVGDLYRFGSADVVAGFGWPLDLAVRSVFLRQIQLGVGWNAMALPLEPTRPLSITQLVRAMNGDGVSRLVNVFRYAPEGWQGVTISGTTVFGDDFQLTPGTGYFLRLARPFLWNLEGYAIDGAVPLDLWVGWNLVGLPQPTGRHAQDIIAETDLPGSPPVHTVQEIDRWVYGAYEGHVAGYPFNNFAIRDDQAYFLRARQSIHYIPGLGLGID